MPLLFSSITKNIQVKYNAGHSFIFTSDGSLYTLLPNPKDVKEIDVKGLDPKRVTEATLGVEGLKEPSKDFEGENYIKKIVGKPILNKIFRKHDVVEYLFEYAYNLDKANQLLHHVILPEDYYRTESEEMNKNATAWTVDNRQCVTCPNPHNQEGGL